MSSPIFAPPPPSSAWQRFYGLVHRLRRGWLQSRARRLPRPVVSVGNLHWGGSGKTPIVAAIAAHLRDAGHTVAILSRGYGSHGRGVRVVSRGEGPLLGPRLAGDEPVLLAGELPGVAVVVGPDRYLAGRHALARLDRPPDLFVLDDGFSHVGLARDLDLLLFPVRDPFAGGRLFPGGRLREPLAAVAHADAVLLTGVPASEAAAEHGRQLARTLRGHGFAGPGFVSHTVPGEPRRLPAGELAPGARVLAVSAIARPADFVATLRRQGFEVAEEIAFPDHHPYPEASLEKIRDAFRQSGASVVLTTGKDRVKLQGRLDLPLAELPIRATPEAAFFKWLDDRLAEIRTSRGS